MKIIHRGIQILIFFLGICSALMLFLTLIGISPYVVLSGSMEPAVQTGSLSFLNAHATFEGVKEGDIIGFRKGEDIMVAHRVIAISEEGMETKGDANEYSDGIAVRKENFCGKIVCTIPKLGMAFEWLQTKKGRITGITALLCLLGISWITSDAFMIESEEAE